MDDGVYLYDPEVPLGPLGELANVVRERINGNEAYYNINTHLNPRMSASTAARFALFERTSATSAAT